MEDLGIGTVKEINNELLECYVLLNHSNSRQNN
jgi:hypothetical protein